MVPCNDAVPSVSVEKYFVAVLNGICHGTCRGWPSMLPINPCRGYLKVDRATLSLLEGIEGEVLPSRRCITDCAFCTLSIWIAQGGML